jgi:carboxymethylenebutenolidase
MPISSDFTQKYVSVSVADCTKPMKILQITPQKSQDSNKVMIVIQEIFGINSSLKQTCLQYANLGYTVLCPDLFHRLDDNVNLTDSNPDDLNQAFAYFNAFNVDTGIADIQSVIHYARHTLTAKKIGAVGYCLGGFLAYLTACNTDVDATVSYYGVNIQSHLDKASNIKKPIMLHIAENDEFVPPEAQEAILHHFKEYSLVTCQKYENVEHAFARVDGVHYNLEAAMLANQKTKDFFETNL